MLEQKEEKTKLIIILSIIITIMIIVIILILLLLNSKNIKTTKDQLTNCLNNSGLACNLVYSNPGIEDSCINLSSELKDKCYFEIAKIKLIRTLCLKISDPSMKNSCLSYILSTSLRGAKI